ncbi:MAG: hypothetical protein WC879_14310 [Melioribacteraceae bacterium]
MSDNKDINELQKAFEELKQKAIETYPALQETLDSFNSTCIDTEEYINFLNLLNDHPLPIASNHSNN